MNKKLKTLITIAVISAATMGTYAISSLAANAEVKVMQLSKPGMTQPMQLRAPKRYHKIICRRCMLVVVPIHRRMWNLGLRRNKNLSASDAKAIVKAALLMRNRKDLSIDKVQTKYSKRGRKLYLIQIVNPNNHVVSKVKLNSSSGRIKPLKFVHPTPKS